MKTKMSCPLLACIGLLLLTVAPRCAAIDLLERYPTTLTTGDSQRARPWEFSKEDMFKISMFRFVLGTLRVECGAANIGVGHCADGAVWVAIIPRAGGVLTSSASAQPESIAHIWLRFHPSQIGILFPSSRVSTNDASYLALQVEAIARLKIDASWQSGGNVLIPYPKDMIVDVDIINGPRRFFVVDTTAQSVRYVPGLENQFLKPPPAITSALAEAAFDQVWSTFDRDYAMFVLRPEVDWNQSRDQFRPLATNSASVYELADVIAQMLQPLRDLHIWLTASGSDVPVFNRPRTLNANTSAYPTLLGNVKTPNPKVQWAVTPEKIGFIAIHGWGSPEIPVLCNATLEQMRDTRGLIVDVRLNGGGSEPLAKSFATRFLHTNFVYAFSQYRNGTNHTDLTEKYPRSISPGGSWRYNRPVILLIGQKCMSSDESFIGMMTGATNVTTMGDHTCGSSGNPKIISLPLDMTVSVPLWIDYLPDGTVLDERGFQPQIPFTPAADSFTGVRDDLLSAAIERLRQVPLPPKPIAGPVAITFDDLTSLDRSIPPGYGGLTWSNFFFYNAVTNYNPGYTAGMVSAPHVAANSFGNPASISGAVPFDMISAVFTAAYNTDLKLEVTGYTGTNLTYNQIFTLSPTTPTELQFNYYGVTSVTFVSYGGTPTPYYANGTNFVMDNLLLAPHKTAAVPPLLKNIIQSDGVLTFDWAAELGETYQVQYTPTLSQTNWINLGPPITATNAILTVSKPSSDQQRFYRVLLLLPEY